MQFLKQEKFKISVQFLFVWVYLQLYDRNYLFIENVCLKVLAISRYNGIEKC